MRSFQRVIVLVMDGCGAGKAPDADDFGDRPGNYGDTLVNVAASVGGLRIPTLRRLGLGNLLGLAGGGPVADPVGSYARLRESSRGGKDTVTGHWEMMGIVVDQPFPTYPNGFPREVVSAFEESIGRAVLGNRAASGTVIIDELGEEHVATGHPILYTSADSVFQIACHEGVVPVDQLYEFCLKARGLLKGEHSLQRVIARPFEGSGKGHFRRTERRKDFPLDPPENVIDKVQAAGIYCSGIGVIPEVFAGRGFDHGNRTQTNEEHYLATLEELGRHQQGFFFVNFEDFDMLFGHRLDPQGFAGALEVFDGYVADIMERMGAGDLLMITADHGNDPTIESTDHTREYAPLLLYSPGLEGGRHLGDRDSFGDVGATVLKAFGLLPHGAGTSLL